MNTTLHKCTRLQEVALRIPYCSLVFLRVVDLISHLERESLQRIILYLDRYPGCSEPTSADWGRLDSVLHQSNHSRLTAKFWFALQYRIVVNEIVWGDWHPFGPLDGDSFRDDLCKFLPETFHSNGPRLYYAVSCDVNNVLTWMPLMKEMN